MMNRLERERDRERRRYRMAVEAGKTGTAQIHKRNMGLLARQTRTEVAS